MSLGLSSSQLSKSLYSDDEMPATQEKTFALAYHEILPSASSYAYHVSSEAFDRQLNYFRNLQVPPRSPSEFMITFDDGHISQVQSAISTLEKSERKGTFFVLPGLIGTTSASISWKDAKLLLNEGHSVESHGWSHRLLTLCSPRELERELMQSKVELECRLGRRVTAISAPGGRWDARVVDACARAGYETLFHSNPWSAPRQQSGITVRGRLMVTGNMTGKSICQMARSGRLIRFARQAKYKVKGGVRSMLGDQLYHSLWCKLAHFQPQDGLEVECLTDRS